MYRLNLYSVISSVCLTILLIGYNSNRAKVDSKSSIPAESNIIGKQKTAYSQSTCNKYTTITILPDGEIINTENVPYDLGISIGVMSHWQALVEMEVYFDDNFVSYIPPLPSPDYEFSENVYSGTHEVKVITTTTCPNDPIPWYNSSTKTYTINLVAPSLEVTVLGPGYLQGGHMKTWEADVSNGTGGYSYQWYYRETRFGSWTAGGTNSKYYSHTFTYAQYPQFAAVKVVVDNGNEQVYDIRPVYVEDPACPPNQLCP